MTAATVFESSFACAVLLLASCTAIVAPDASTVTVTVNPDTIGVGGDSAAISAVFVDPSGEPVIDGTQVVFLTTLGAMCPANPASASNSTSCGKIGTLSPATLTTKTTRGIANAVLHSGNLAGAAQVTAESGKASASATVTISGLVAPSNSVMQMAATPDTIAINSGTTVIRVFVLSGGVPVPDGTLMVFKSTGGSITPSIALSQSGFAVTTLANVTVSGLDTVRVSSGTVRDSITVLAH
jgi:hypothetical protein